MPLTILQHNKHEPGGGFFTEGCLALVEGTYTDDDTRTVLDALVSNIVL
jgi:hypothetical protein